MVKVFLKLVSHERICVKEGAGAKEQFLEIIKFADRLDTFYTKLSIAEYSVHCKMFVIILCMFHGQSAV